MQQIEKNLKVTLITVTYNSSNKIRNLLLSLNNDSKYIQEVIIVENNSSDKQKTKRIIQKLRETLNFKTSFHIMKENFGFAYSCNYGAMRANSKYILFINPDTQVKDKAISKLLLHGLSSEADIIGGRVEYYSGSVHNTAVRKPNLLVSLFEFSNLGKLFGLKHGHIYFYYLDNPKVQHAANDIEVDAVSGVYLLAKRDSFILLKGFDTKFFMYLEDVDLGTRAKELGMKVVFCPHSMIMHEGGASSNNKYKIHHQAWYDSRKMYIHKHFNWLANLIIQPLYSVEEWVLKAIKK